MIAEILATNRQRHLAAVRVDDGITVVAWRGTAQLHEGDIICGNLMPHATNSHCFNVSRGEALKVSVVVANCSDDGAVNLLFV